MEKTIAVFSSFAEAEKADREFYRKLSGETRLAILLELTENATERPLERVYRITKFSNRDSRKTEKRP